MALWLLLNLASLDLGWLKNCLYHGQWLLPFLENISQTDLMSYSHLSKG